MTDPKQVGREAAAKLIDLLRGLSAAERDALTRGAVAGATEMLARMGGAEGGVEPDPRNKTINAGEAFRELRRAWELHGKGSGEKGEALYQSIMRRLTNLADDTAAAPSQPAGHSPKLKESLQNAADSLASRPVELRGPFKSGATKQPTGKKWMSDMISVPRKDLKRLCFMARTSGGTAGRDEGLVAALDKIEPLLAKHPNVIERKFSKENAHKLRDEGAVGAGVTPSTDAIRREAIEECMSRFGMELMSMGGDEERTNALVRRVRHLVENAPLAAPAREG